VLDIIAQRTDPHKVFVIISGGEPLVREDLEKCGRAIYEKGFPWGMVTNGLAMTEKRFRRLLSSGMHSMTVSLDGLKDEHDWMRGVAGSFERARDAIRMAASTPELAFDVVTCVNQRNFSTLPAIRDLLISLGVREWRLFTVFPVGRAKDDPLLQISPSQFRGLMDFIRDERRKWEKASDKSALIKPSYGCEGFLGSYEGDVRDHFFTCQAGITVGSVLIDGSISACGSIRADYHQGNIYTDNFMDVWENRFQSYYDRSWMKKDECGECKWWKWCKGGGMHLRDENGKLILCHMKKLCTPDENGMEAVAP